jgi:hypothetical protein
VHDLRRGAGVEADMNKAWARLERWIDGGTGVPDPQRCVSVLMIAVLSAAAIIGGCAAWRAV